MQSVTLIDGGMGQELVRRAGVAPSPLWSAQVMLDNPALVRGLHEDFIESGAQVITVNSYSMTPERLARDGARQHFDALQQSACDVAMQARVNAGRADVRISGCLPPLYASYHPDLMPSMQQAQDSYQRIVDAQQSSVDLFQCETMSSIDEALAASSVAIGSGKPVWLALSLDDSSNDAAQPRLRSGEPLREAVDALKDSGISALMLNCSRPETITRSWTEFTANNTLPIGAYANGFTSVESLRPGGTVTSLEARHDLGPDQYADFAMQWVTEGATIVGGCCEVGPAHIATLRRRIDALND